ncbi:MAG: hypothetical protein M3O46_21055 [Myxococcota bacterium]|nr:hypothetical protein [Myxococcota bacterium]
MVRPPAASALFVALMGTATHCGGEKASGALGPSSDSGSDSRVAAEGSVEASPDVAALDAAPVACCAGDRDCAPGLICSVTLCLAPEAGACWRDIDCQAGDRCVGVRICPCNADCNYTAVAGRCGFAPDAGAVAPCPSPPALPNGAACAAAQAGSECSYALSQFGPGYCLCEKDGSSYTWHCQ